MSLRFRVATAPDLPAILSMLREDKLGAERETAPDAIYAAMFARIARRSDCQIVVGEIEDRVIACYQLTVLDGISMRGARRGQIEDVRVAEDLRGQGIGHQMLQDAEARAKQLGCSVLQLVAHHTREDAHRFYMSLGFTPSHVGFKRVLPRPGDTR